MSELLHPQYLVNEYKALTMMNLHWRLGALMCVENPNRGFDVYHYGEDGESRLLYSGRSVQDTRRFIKEWYGVKIQSHNQICVL